VTKKIDGEKKGPVEVVPENRMPKEEPRPTFIAIHWNREKDTVGVSAKGFANDIEREGFVSRFCKGEVYERLLANQRQAEAAADNGGT
jgi:hypothetical protein